jgi:two-component system osmolarity sensor histidine kinase EnvZ
MKIGIIKKILPVSLFNRFILIIILPTIITQLFSAYMFYQRHWSNVITHISNNLIGEVIAITEIYKNPPLSQNTTLMKVLKNSLKVQFKFTPQAKIHHHQTHFVYLYQSLHEELKMPVNIIDHEVTIELEIQLPKGVLYVYVPRKRLANPTTYIFILWMSGAATVFSILSIIFLRNQLESIKKLSQAAQSLGKGRQLINFKPSGAIEVRKAGAAFLKMKQRIESHILQRTTMLAGVSHDLRTPLTRIKLQLAMLEQNQDIIEMKEDVVEMEKMIQHYLDFAKGEEGEKSVIVEVGEILKNSVSHYNNILENLELNITTPIILPIKVNAIKRAFTNIMDNAAKYANKVVINAYLTDKYLVLEFHDNGPGIDPKELKAALGAFYRIDDSRNSQTGGVGLGLSICKDIVSAHGGKLFLQQSQILGGLKVIIRIPL